MRNATANLTLKLFSTLVAIGFASPALANDDIYPFNDGIYHTMLSWSVLGSLGLILLAAILALVIMGRKQEPRR